MADFSPVGVQAIVRDLEKFLGDLKKMDSGIEETGKKSESLGSQFAKAGEGVLKFGAVAAGAALGGAVALAGGLAGLALKTAASADELVELADKTGISVERLQELKFIGDQTGTSVESVTGSISRMVRGMGDAATGTGAAKDAFAALGISVVDSSGNLRNSQTVFGEVIDALGKIDNETQRDAIAMDIFGRSARELNPLVLIGSSGMAQMAEQARGLGAVMSESTARSAADFNDKLGALKMGLAGIGMQIGAAVIPILSQLVDQVIVPAIPIIQAMAASVSQFVTDLASNIDWNAVVAGITSFFESLKPVADFLINNWQPIFAGLAAAILALVIPAFVAWAAAAWASATATIAALAPVLVPILAIGAAVALLVAAWQNDWGGIRTTITGIWNNTLAPIFEAIRAWLAENIPVALKALSSFWTGTLLPAITSVYNFFSENILPIFQDVIDIATMLGKIALTALAGFWENILLPAITKVYNFFTESILPILKDVKTFIVDEIGPKVQWFADKVISPLASTVSGGLVKALQTLHDWLGKIKEMLSNIHLPSWLTPGSPTPFETGLVGIAEATGEVVTGIGNLSRSLRGFPVAMLEDVFKLGGGFGTFGGAVATRFTKQTLDPLKARIDAVVAQQKALQDVMDEQGFGDIGQLSEMNRLEAQRVALVTEYAKQQQKILDMQQQEADLSFLKAQLDFLKLLKEEKLDLGSILGGLKLGLEADLPGLLAAMTNAIGAMVAKANDTLQARSPSKVFAAIGQNIMQGLAGGMQSMLGAPLGAMQASLATLAAAPRVAAPAIVRQQSVQIGPNNFGDGMDLAFLSGMVERAMVGALQ